MKQKIFVLLFLLVLYACDMFEYHPYDGHIKGEVHINSKNIKQIEESCKGKTTIRFAMLGDTQRRYDETRDFVKTLNKRDDIDFVILAGDVSDFGMTEEFMWIRDIMNNLKAPYVTLIGNHDCLGNGEYVFKEIFGDLNFSFLAGDTKFVCLNTNALEYDYSRPVPDFQFIEKELADDRAEYKKTVFAMHVRPFEEQFNNNVANVFQYSISRFRNLQFCLNAHDHIISADDLFDDGIIYYGTADIGSRSYLIFTLNPDDEYEYEVVYF